ncbi:CLUMA_CG008605, isoform A [Clunio marinus]|uniref:CLUMA_CG008605, isoform A n=1 Tax=Clunio marinus TaxID=568069 RepID=A0A1J1I460_9DIPT|nr:CLUMA_CG008605, isoform A [Clunio marinus]
MSISKESFHVKMTICHSHKIFFFENRFILLASKTMKKMKTKKGFDSGEIRRCMFATFTQKIHLMCCSAMGDE